MNYKRILICLLALICAASFAACGQDSRTVSASKLISAYFNVNEQNKDAVTILDVAAWQDGYLALALYTGSGSHLVLFKVEKGSDGPDKLTAMCEGTGASGCGLSVNIVTDGGQTIMFGSFANTAEDGKTAKSDISDIAFTMDNENQITDKVNGGMGFIVAAEGTPKVKDFTLTGTGGKVAGGYQEYIKAGCNFTRSGFVPVPAK